MNKKIISLLVLLITWFCLGLIISNDVILPGPLAVGSRLIEMMQDGNFYLMLGATFLRAHVAFLVSLLLGVSLAFMSFKWESFEMIISPWLKSLQTIPQISFIILLLFWLDTEASILCVVMLMAFPIAYFNQLEALNSIEQDYLDIIWISHQPWWYNFKKAYFPLSYSGFKATVQGVLPICIKVTIMSEVLIFTNIGLGRALNHARANIDMIGVFSWTIALIGLMNIEMSLLKKFVLKK